MKKVQAEIIIAKIINRLEVNEFYKQRAEREISFLLEKELKLDVGAINVYVSMHKDIIIVKAEVDMEFVRTGIYSVGELVSLPDLVLSEDKEVVHGAELPLDNMSVVESKRFKKWLRSFVKGNNHRKFREGREDPFLNLN